MKRLGTLILLVLFGLCMFAGCTSQRRDLAATLAAQDAVTKATTAMVHSGAESTAAAKATYEAVVVAEAGCRVWWAAIQAGDSAAAQAAAAKVQAAAADVPKNYQVASHAAMGAKYGNTVTDVVAVVSALVAIVNQLAALQAEPSNAQIEQAFGTLDKDLAALEAALYPASALRR